jgi:ABC-2 type transport system permease protein
MTSWKVLLTRAQERKNALADDITWQASLLKAIGFEVAQHARNRLALALVVFFIPCWLGLVRAIIPGNPIDFHSRIVGHPVTVIADELGMISGAINAVTLIVGFMMFAAMRRSSDFDQRLVFAGYSRPCLLLAKLIALFLIVAVVAGYATITMSFFWEPQQAWLLGMSLLSSALTYGGMGIVLGVIVPTELAGMFAIIMISLVDVMVQNPIINPAEEQELVRFLPTYGAMQSAVAASFTSSSSLWYLMLGPLWLFAFALFGMLAFYLRTKDYTQHAELSKDQTTTATVILTARPDGTVRVESSSGAILVCSHLDSCAPNCAPPKVKTETTGAGRRTSGQSRANRGRAKPVPNAN